MEIVFIFHDLPFYQASLFEQDLVFKKHKTELISDDKIRADGGLETQEDAHPFSL
jgi:hypothetical protein